MGVTVAVTATSYKHGLSRRSELTEPARRGPPAAAAGNVTVVMGHGHLGGAAEELGILALLTGQGTHAAAQSRLAADGTRRFPDVTFNGPV